MAASRPRKFRVIQSFEVKELFGTDENVAVFGTFTYKSNTLGKVATSPFSILAKVRNGKIVYFQFMEDTFATAATFRVFGHWKIHSDPKGEEFELWPPRSAPGDGSMRAIAVDVLFGFRPILRSSHGSAAFLLIVHLACGLRVVTRSHSVAMLAQH
jgi:hypothetical protein